MRYPFYYSGSPNFGDALNPVLYKKITGEDCKWTPPDTQGKILACGSIAQEALPFDIIWGTGVIFPEVELKCCETTHFLAGRGPLSAELLYKKIKSEPITLCDPGLLISSFIPPSKKTKKIGIIPHYIDRDIIIRDNTLNKYYIDIMSGVENVISCVTTCDMIISSALHGIICAESYGIPSLWVELSDNVAGNGFKFNDYYQGTGRHSKPLNWRNKRSLDEAIELLKYGWQPPESDLNLLMSVCPFTWDTTDYKRWGSVNGTWDARNETIAKIISKDSSVIEFGAGSESLKSMLECNYVASDIYKRNEDTVVCDLNTSIFPDLSSYDTIVMSGVLEYIYVDNIIKFIDYTKKYNIKTFICSYEHGCHPDMRKFNGWVNDLTKGDLVRMFEGYTLEHDYGGIYKFIR